MDAAGHAFSTPRRRGHLRAPWRRAGCATGHPAMGATRHLRRLGRDALQEPHTRTSHDRRDACPREIPASGVQAEAAAVAEAPPRSLRPGLLPAASRSWRRRSRRRGHSRPRRARGRPETPHPAATHRACASSKAASARPRRIRSRCTWAASGGLDADDVFVRWGGVGAARADRLSTWSSASVGAAMAGEPARHPGLCEQRVARDATVEQGVVRTMIAQQVTFTRPSAVLVMLAGERDRRGPPAARLARRAGGRCGVRPDQRAGEGGAQAD